MHIIPEFSHRASLADLQLICKPTVRLCNQRLWVYLQKSFLWREPYQTHCGDTFATDLAFRSRCITTECHRWRCRLIPRTGPGHSLGAPRGNFFTFPAQNLAYGMRYNARDCGVQLSVNLISRLEEEGPTRLYACHKWIQTLWTQIPSFEGWSLDWILGFEKVCKAFPKSFGFQIVCKTLLKSS